jgi:hypothetical protein
LRENKNRYLFTYLKSLIDCKVFNEIYLEFLPVGHTHCDIDQMFSRFSTFLKGEHIFSQFLFIEIMVRGQCVEISVLLPYFVKKAHPAFDFVEFATNLKKAFSPCKVVQFVKRFINFRDTVDPLLNNCANTPGAENFSSFRYKV